MFTLIPFIVKILYIFAYFSKPFVELVLKYYIAVGVLFPPLFIIQKYNI
jgi:hypothetical protein